jgi:membrane-associated phospholipid phosphatase
MKKSWFIVGYLSICFLKVKGQDTLSFTNQAHVNQEPLYKLKPAVDIPIIALAGGWSYYALSKIYKKDSSSAQQILALNKNNINGFDRWAADVYHPAAGDLSDKFFFFSMPWPLVLLADRDIRKDALKIGVMYTEALSITGVLYTSATYLNRYRPYTYNSALTLEQKRSGNSKNSFFAGHVGLVATSTFFTAKVFSDYHPHSKLKWLFYSVAAGATGATGYLRHRAGKHFPSDIILGTAIGTLSGIMVPQFHKIKKKGNDAVHIYPFAGFGTQVLTILYKIK